LTTKLVDNRRLVFFSPRADRIGEEGDVDVFIRRLKAGLVDADGGFKADYQEMVDFVFALRKSACETISVGALG